MSTTPTPATGFTRNDPLPLPLPPQFRAARARRRSLVSHLERGLFPVRVPGAWMVALTLYAGSGMSLLSLLAFFFIAVFLLFSCGGVFLVVSLAVWMVKKGRLT